jgi:hypothetical protein
LAAACPALQQASASAGPRTLQFHPRLPRLPPRSGLTRIKDEGLGYLAQCTSLTQLSATNEDVTNAGVLQLSALTNLQSLALRDCCEVCEQPPQPQPPPAAAGQSLRPSLAHSSHPLALGRGRRIAPAPLPAAAPPP